MPKKGYRQTAEHRAKLSAAALNRQPPESHRTPVIHGMTGTATYNSWSTMKQRCLNPRNPKYPSYGGRGIAIDPRWLRFEDFLADMGVRPDGRTLDRIDNDGNYEPGNCRWATPGEQISNRRPQRPRRCGGCGMLACKCVVDRAILASNDN